MTKEQQRTLEIALSQGLPYGLKLWDRDSEPGSEVILLTGICVTDSVTTVSDEHGNFDIPLVDIKPLLRPLSDLTKEITHNGESFIPIEKLRQSGITDHLDWISNERDYLVKDRGFYGWLGEIPFKTIEHLNEWKFDYRGLINSGLAISVHDLPENPYL